MMVITRVDARNAKGWRVVQSDRARVAAAQSRKRKNTRHHGRCFSLSTTRKRERNRQPIGDEQ